MMMKSMMMKSIGSPFEHSKWVTQNGSNDKKNGLVDDDDDDIDDDEVDWESIWEPLFLSFEPFWVTHLECSNGLPIDLIIIDIIIID